MGRHTSVCQPYEVRVVIHGRTQSKRYDARDHKQAIEKAQDAGYDVLHAHKVNQEKILPAIKNLKLLDPIGIKDTAIALGNIAFRRAKRIEGNKLDKPID